jgi:hypothetical protein
MDSLYLEEYGSKFLFPHGHVGSGDTALLSLTCARRRHPSVNRNPRSIREILASAFCRGKGRQQDG